MIASASRSSSFALLGRRVVRRATLALRRTPGAPALRRRRLGRVFLVLQPLLDLPGPLRQLALERVQAQLAAPLTQAAQFRSKLLQARPDVPDHVLGRVGIVP